MSNRKVSTDALETLGTIIGPNEKRDAIHLAVIPAVARERLLPGEHVSYANGEAFASITPHTGIVDPFLTRPVLPGDRFWFVLLPRTVTSLRHVWSHPAFKDDDAEDSTKQASISWITQYAAGFGLTFENLINAANDYLDCGAYLTGGSEMEGEVTSEEFWTHFAIVTGRQVSLDKRDNFFSCSC